MNHRIATPLRRGAGTLARLALVAGLLGPAAAGQILVSGQVVDPGLAGVPGVNIDFYDSATGAVVTIFNDGTDPGGFFNVTAPLGTFDIWFLPPVSSGLAPKFLLNVSVTGNLNLGQVPVVVGSTVNGTLKNNVGVGLPGVSLTVQDSFSGVIFPITPKQSGIGGTWSFLLPPSTYDFFFDPDAAYGTTIAPGQILDVDASTSVNTGILTLPPGHVLSGTIHDNLGAPVANADTDVRDPFTGKKLFTPNDNADAAGFFDVTVPAGTWDLEIDPPKTTKLVALIQRQVVVSGNTSVGIVQVQPGVFIQGTITGPGGVVQGVDLDVIQGWQEQVTPGDNTDAAGFYQAVVVPGTYLLDYTPAPGSGLGRTAVTPVTIGGDTVVDVTLAASTCTTPVTNYGAGTAGTGGFVPLMGRIGGDPTVGNSSFAITVRRTTAGVAGVFFLGIGQGALPVMGGMLLVDVSLPFGQVPTFTSGTPGIPGQGGAVLPLSVPNNPGLVGFSFYFQTVLIDGSIVFSDGLQVPFCP